MNNKPTIENLPPAEKIVSGLSSEDIKRQERINAKLAEIEASKQKIISEIKASEEKIALYKKIESAENTLSRRSFIKGGLAAIATGLIMKSDGGKETTINEEVKPKEKVERVEYEIRRAKEIIETENFKDIIKNPYLVSTLYYSSKFLDTIKKPYESAQYEIVAEIYEHIKKKEGFRARYIDYLTALAKEANKNSISEKESKPLDNVTIGEELEKNHKDAIDLFIKEGSAVYSVSGGVVVLAEKGWKKDDTFSTSSEKGGNTVIIFNPHNKSFYRYAHMQDTNVKPGKVLLSGDKIGLVGHTGTNANSGRGGHLHFEINRFDGKNGMIVTDVFELKNKLEKFAK